MTTPIANEVISIRLTRSAVDKGTGYTLKRGDTTIVLPGEPEIARTRGGNG
ncbi:MAG: hypothetical protein VCG02_01585 [Verrucomicrobiota bacterium]